MSTIDAEATVTTYLSAQGVGAKIVGEVPRDTGQAFVKVTQIGVMTLGNQNADYFHRYHLQMDCYAGEDGPEGQGQASALQRAVRDAMAVIQDSVSGITACYFTNAIRLPDEDFTPARQRFILDCQLYGKPA